jgi:hypothetical protein
VGGVESAVGVLLSLVCVLGGGVAEAWACL